MDGNKHFLFSGFLGWLEIYFSSVKTLGQVTEFCCLFQNLLNLPMLIPLRKAAQEELRGRGISLSCYCKSSGTTRTSRSPVAWLEGGHRAKPLLFGDAAHPSHESYSSGQCLGTPHPMLHSAGDNLSRCDAVWVGSRKSHKAMLMFSYRTITLTMQMRK